MNALAPLLEIQGITKRFGGLIALDAVSFTVMERQIFGLIGPNGAGKSTLFNVVTGLYPADAGAVRLGGALLASRSPHQVAQRGIARTFQNIRLFNSMTAQENVMVGRHVRTQAGLFSTLLHSRRMRTEEAAIRAHADELLAYVGLSAQAGRIAGQLSYGDQRRLEIARALATEPHILALDEPAAGMNPAESAGLKALLQRIRDDGVTVLLIEHNVKLVMGLCDRLAVLDYGHKIAEGTPAEVQANAQVIEAYLGAGGNA